MVAQANKRPASNSSTLSSVDCFDDHSLFSELMSYAPAFEEVQGYCNTHTLTMTAPSDSPDLAESLPGATFEPFFNAVDESFDLFDLELEFCMSLSTPKPAPELFDLSAQASAKWSFELPVRNPECEQPQPKKRKKSSLKTSSQRQREEIKSLRATAAQLECELQRLKAASQPEFSSIVVDESLYSAASDPRSLWECVARRQEAARQLAKQTNAALRQNIKTNLKLATSLEQSLRLKQHAFRV